MIELKKTKYEFKLDGKVICLNAPSVSDIEKLQEVIKTKGETVDTTLDFLALLGLDKKLARGMEASHLEVIVEAVSGAKKN